MSSKRAMNKVLNVLTISRRYCSQARSEGGQQGKKLLLLVIPVTAFGLGTWQVQRLQWKKGLIADLERRTMQPPVTIPIDISNRLKEFEYRRVTLTGQFDHAHEIYMWPRGQLIEGGSRQSLPNQTAEPGAHVITPFYCNETKNRVLVNRGWVPRTRMDPNTRPDGQVEGEITITGLVRTQENRAPFSPKNDPERNRWSYRDVDSMARMLNTAPVLVDADATTTVAGGPKGGQTRVTLRNEHLQYIVTWYSLSLATFYMFWKVWSKGKK